MLPAVGARTQLSSYAESEITSLVPQAPSSFPSFTIRTASDGKLGGSLETRLLIQHSKILFAYMITAKKRSPSHFFAVGHAVEILLGTN